MVGTGAAGLGVDRGTCGDLYLTMGRVGIATGSVIHRGIGVIPLMNLVDGIIDGGAVDGIGSGGAVDGHSCQGPLPGIQDLICIGGNSACHDDIMSCGGITGDMNHGRGVLAVAVDIVIHGAGEVRSGNGPVAGIAPGSSKGGCAVIGRQNVVGGFVHTHIGQGHGHTGGAAFHAGAHIIAEVTGWPVFGIKIAVAGDLRHISNGAAGNVGRIAVLDHCVGGVAALGGSTCILRKTGKQCNQQCADQ